MQAIELTAEHVGKVVTGETLSNGVLQVISAAIVAVIYHFEPGEGDAEPTLGGISVQTTFYTFSYAPTDSVVIQ